MYIPKYILPDFINTAIFYDISTNFTTQTPIGYTSRYTLLH